MSDSGLPWWFDSIRDWLKNRKSQPSSVELSSPLPCGKDSGIVTFRPWFGEPVTNGPSIQAIKHRTASIGPATVEAA
jgi:hypothetical protein